VEISVIAHQALLYGHIIAFSLALATILKEDVRLLQATRTDPASLLASAKSVKWLLMALWVTGVPMVAMDIGADVSLLLDKPKLVAKLIVVGALTLNGIMLHLVAFPMLTSKHENPGKAATIAATLGAVSTTSWLFAFLLGAARVIAPYFSLYEFVILYLSALALAVLLAVLFVRGRLERLLIGSLAVLPDASPAQGHSLSIALLEAEIARLALSDIQMRLRTKQPAQPVSTYRRASPARSFGESQMAVSNPPQEMHRVVRRRESTSV
jgi:hypothetical protein